jgi:hypothetical protein
MESNILDFFARKELSCDSFSFSNILKVNVFDKFTFVYTTILSLIYLLGCHVETFSLFCSALMRRLRRPRTYLHFKNYWFLPQLLFAPLFIKDNQNWSLFGLYLKEVIPKRDILTILFIYWGDKRHGSRQSSFGLNPWHWKLLCIRTLNFSYSQTISFDILVTCFLFVNFK